MDSATEEIEASAQGLLSLYRPSGSISLNKLSQGYESKSLPALGISPEPYVPGHGGHFDNYILKEGDFYILSEYLAQISKDDLLSIQEHESKTWK